VKSTKPQACESKKERRQTHQRLFTQFGQTWPNMTKRYKWVTRNYHKSSQRTKPNFYLFSQSHQWTRHSMIFTHPRCLQCFPTQENLTTKTLTSFVLPRFLSWSSTQKMKNEAFYSVQQTSKSATEQSSSATKFLPSYCTNSALSAKFGHRMHRFKARKTANGKAGKTHKIGCRGQQFGARFFIPSNFNFKSISTVLIHIFILIVNNWIWKTYLFFSSWKIMVELIIFSWRVRTISNHKHLYEKFQWFHPRVFINY